MIFSKLLFELEEKIIEISDFFDYILALLTIAIQGSLSFRLIQCPFLPRTFHIMFP
jgi:hypothetical protein